ncbi:MAG: S49 family peptidase [Planctomycetes bacterium]|nr:S49 family peptidase [Planctomycetota bacterium]
MRHRSRTAAIYRPSSIGIVTEKLMRDKHVMQAIASGVWAILPEKLDQILRVVGLHASGRVDLEEIERYAGRERAEPRTVAFEEPGLEAAAGGTMPSNRAVRVIPVHGVLGRRLGMLSAMSGGASTERISAQVREALNDRAIDSIVLDVDSPGGEVYGITELAEIIYQGRSQKRIVAVANSLAASAAYWIATAADEIVISPSGDVGSIGVIAMHSDLSKQDEALGITRTLISAGRFKTEGNDAEPLSESAHEFIQDRVDSVYRDFIDAVARGRGRKGSEVRAQFGEGRIVRAKDAVRRGMADRVDTLENTISRLRTGAGRSRRRRTAATAAPLEQPCATCYGTFAASELTAENLCADCHAAEYVRRTDAEAGSVACESCEQSGCTCGSACSSCSATGFELDDAGRCDGCAEQQAALAAKAATASEPARDENRISVQLEARRLELLS